MKPFKSSEFISNEETPVVVRNGKPVEIITVKGRGDQQVLGYIDKGEEIKHWWCSGEIGLGGKESDWDLFFAPKLEVVHIFKRNPIDGFIVVNEKKDIEFWMNQPDYTHLGTITGPIVPPEKSKERNK